MLQTLRPPRRVLSGTAPTFQRLYVRPLLFQRLHQLQPLLFQRLYVRPLLFQRLCQLLQPFRRVLQTLQYGSVFFRKFVSFYKIISNFFNFSSTSGSCCNDRSGKSSTLPAVLSCTASPPAILSAISSASRAHTSRATSAPRTSPPAPAFSVLQSLASSSTGSSSRAPCHVCHSGTLRTHPSVAQMSKESSRL